MKQKIKLLIIDPQVDFVDPNGALYVNNAENSIKNLVHFIEVMGHKLDDIYVTLDKHHRLHIAHPLFWIDKNGNHPKPLSKEHVTIITVDDVKSEKWRTTIPTLRDWGLEYVRKLKENDRYDLCIWPPHCLIGSPGSNIHPDLLNALHNWEDKYVGMVNKVSKGSNIKTEHYSAIKADVEDPEDKCTLLNIDLVEELDDSTILFESGWASSHCTKFTSEDIDDNFGADSTKKVHLLTDCMDPVKGFEQQADEFLHEMEQKGAHLVTTNEIIKGGL